MKMEKYSAYKSGLKIGDYVHYEYNCIFTAFVERSLILDRKHLFTKETRWGERSFFEYSVYNNGNVKKIRTQDMRIINCERTS